MLIDVEWSQTRKYRNLTSNEPFDFYIKALTNSNHFDLLLGYFSSAAINILSLGFARFIQNGGVFRIIANNVLSEADAKLITNEDSQAEENYLIDLTNLDLLESHLNQYGIHFFECLAYLKKIGRLQFLLIKPKGKNGIAHYKEGYFSDSLNSISFSGSCNFTKNGLLSNLEGFTTFLDWDQGPSKIQVEEQKIFFEKIWNGESDFFSIIDSSEIEIAITNNFGGKELDELIVDERELFEQFEDLLKRDGIAKTLDYLNNLSEKYETNVNDEMKFPYPKPHKYQIEAYENWKSNNHKGLFAMATGTGKTLTALNCLINEYKIDKIQKNIIVVPGKELVEQWNDEMLNCHFIKPIKWYSGNNNLIKDIEYIKVQINSSSYELNLIITYDSFSSKKFINLIGPILKDFTVIFDEAHNMGAEGFMNGIKKIEFNKTIGLSATPLRLWDENGENDFIEKFFETKYPYTYYYSMESAIKDGYLCKYKYEPFFVNLTDSEWEEYLELTSKIPIAKKDENINTIAALKRQLLKDQATNKFDIVIEIIRLLINQNSYKNTLIYCPKGVDDFNEESYIVNLNKKILREIPDLNIFNFVSETKDRELLLKDFENGLVDMLLAIKCLDEGVNIPKTMNAIFVASGQNHREFVQRRGRVLRNYETETFKKEFAQIFDIIILPSLTQYTRSTEVAKKLIISEFVRLYEFNNLAIEDLNVKRKIAENLSIFGLTESYIKTLINNRNY